MSTQKDTGSGKPKCPICSSNLNYPPDDQGGGPHFDCKWCGKFAFSDMLDPSILGKNEIERLRHLLFERRLKGGAPICFAPVSGGMAREKTMMPPDEFLASYPKSALEYFDRVLENLGQMVNHPATVRQLFREEFASLFAEDANALSMLTQIEGLGYIDAPRGAYSYRITPKGWARLREIQLPGRDSKQAFVAMSFAGQFTDFFDKGIKPAIEADKRMIAYRIDRQDHNNRIDDEIIAQIRRSRYLVSDFTAHRQGVYFEAGFALGLGLPVIWCVHDDHLKDAHFDTRQYNHITYSTPEELRVKLLNRIRATIV